MLKIEYVKTADLIPYADAGYLVERLIEIEPGPVQPDRGLTWYEYLAEVRECG